MVAVLIGKKYNENTFCVFGKPFMVEYCKINVAIITLTIIITVGTEVEPSRTPWKELKFTP